MQMMVEQLISLGRTLGIPGLFTLALLDSSGIPACGGPDLLLGLLVVQEPDLAGVLLAAPGDSGSLSGCRP